MVAPLRRCEWCGRGIARKRPHARTCGKACRQARARFGADDARERPLERHGYDDDAPRLASVARVAVAARECAWCHGSLDGKRAHARTCSKPCRQALARTEQPSITTADERARLNRKKVSRGAGVLAHRVAALFVEEHGHYYEIPGVDPWPIDRDARLYAGPDPVVAHPPCSRWCQLAGLVQARWGYARGQDDGCFAAALEAVRRWGGVLEHPAYSLAWDVYELERPARFGGWSGPDAHGGFVCHVEQGRYGHPARKATWLYLCGLEAHELPALRWGHLPTGSDRVLVRWVARDPDDARPHIGRARASRTPPEFRAVLLSLARSCVARRDRESVASGAAASRAPSVVIAAASSAPAKRRAPRPQLAEPSNAAATVEPRARSVARSGLGGTVAGDVESAPPNRRAGPGAARPAGASGSSARDDSRRSSELP